VTLPLLATPEGEFVPRTRRIRGERTYLGNVVYVLRMAFLGRTSTEDQQDPRQSLMRQL